MKKHSFGFNCFSGAYLDFIMEFAIPEEKK